MSKKPIPIGSAARAASAAPAATMPFAARLVELGSAGSLVVETAAGVRHDCQWLQVSALPAALREGDTVLVLPLPASAVAVVIGRITTYDEHAALPEVLQIATAQTLSLRCGESSIDLRADGKVMIRGDDVLVRAKGTQRIRAGTVSIN